jgi:hypothetical protein
LKIKFRPSLGAKEMIFSKKEKPKTEPGGSRTRCRRGRN